MAAVSLDRGRVARSFLPAWQWPLLQPVRRLDASMPLTGTLPVGQLQWVLGSETVVRPKLKVRPGP